MRCSAAVSVFTFWFYYCCSSANSWNKKSCLAFIIECNHAEEVGCRGTFRRNHPAGAVARSPKMTPWRFRMWVTRLVVLSVCFTTVRYVLQKHFAAKFPISLIKPKLSPDLWFMNVWWCSSEFLHCWVKICCHTPQYQHHITHQLLMQTLNHTGHSGTLTLRCFALKWGSKRFTDYTESSVAFDLLLVHFNCKNCKNSPITSHQYLSIFVTLHRLNIQSVHWKTSEDAACPQPGCLWLCRSTSWLTPRCPPR